MWDDDSERDDGLLVGTVVPNTLLADIGAVAVYYSHVDWQLSRVIQMLLGLKYWPGMMVTQSVASFASRVDLFRGLAFKKYKKPELRERISKIVEQLRIAGDDRNRLMHDSIFMSMNAKNSGRAAIRTMRENPVTRSDNVHHFDVPTIRDLQRRLNELQWILFDLSHKNNDWLNARLPSLDKSPTLLLRKKNEALQKQEQQRLRRRSSRRKSQSKGKAQRS